MFCRMHLKEEFNQFVRDLDRDVCTLYKIMVGFGEFGGRRQWGTGREQR